MISKTPCKQTVSGTFYAFDTLVLLQHFLHIFRNLPIPAANLFTQIQYGALAW